MPFRTILSPVDFDENSFQALETAAELARLADATVHVLHVLTPAGFGLMAADVDACVTEEQAAKERLVGVCGEHLGGVRHEVLTRTGDPAIAIIHAQEELKADLVVIATHASRKIARPFPGSVAERVVRESICPVVTVRPSPSGDPDAVGAHMTRVPLTALLDTTVARLRQMISQDRCHSVPVLDGGKVVGMVTDRDIAFSDATPDTTIGMLMTREVIMVSPRTSIQEAARILFECEVDGLPVVEDERLVGIITRSDILKVFANIEPGSVLRLRRVLARRAPTVSRG
ncbi:MAG: universal stress protein [Candidatus Binataceae bacterium]|jgi:predicted transcriptional regulator